MATNKKTETDTPNELSSIDVSKMSEGKRKALEMAEESREKWEHKSFTGGLFMGRFSWDLIHPFPGEEAAKPEIGDKFLKNMETYLREKVDADAIDETGEIPQPVMDGLAKLGAFGIKISSEYGGLGQSQSTYSRAAMLLGSHCGNLPALLSAHQSIGVPQPLKMFGTEAQKKKYLPRCAGGEISAFALTEDEAGSDPAKLSTRAEPTPDGEHFVLNGTKLWCTNGTKAGVIVVMAQTPPKEVRGKLRNPITAFIVETDTPGVTVAHRCRFMGLRSLYNAVIRLEDVHVPRENILLGEGKGLKVALSTLNTGRLTLPAGCVGLAKRCLKITRDWAGKREQWGAPIGRHAAIADKIARMAATTFAMESVVLLSSALVDRGDADIRLESAMCKLFGSEAAWRIVDDTMQIRGGRGYETASSLKARGEEPIAVERCMRDARINTIFEGSSEIMRLFIAREALDPHLKAAGGLLNSRLPLGARLKDGIRAALFYATWYPAKWLPISPAGLSGMDPKLAGHVRWAARNSRRLARRLFVSMALHGSKLEREQVLLGRFVDIGTDLFAIAATCSRAQSLLINGNTGGHVLPVADPFCREARVRLNANFGGIRTNNDRSGYRLARHILKGEMSWMESGIVGHPD
ncbi:MAG: acyl-CoA dehydrogenase family protein [Verrucomicrobia bacterium]|nr:acyl-CoA dehydrogenase family protein [Verrucomicrobiota bacterium]